MAGLFGGIGRKVKGLLGDDPVSKLARAQALMNSDYAGAARISGMMQDNDLQRRKAQQGQQQYEAVRQSLVAEGLPEHVVNGFMANPDNVSAYFLEKFKTRSGGAEGISRQTVDPRTGAISTSVSPGWHNGDFFGGTDGTQAPQRLYQGEKVFPVEKGGYLGVYGGPQGAPQTAQPAASNAGPTPGTVEDGFIFKGGNPADPNSWAPVNQGGPSLGGSGGFRRPY